ncbi:hypothetical protein ACG74X_14620 [Marivita sp. S0852]|uniref:hypothetical protein n=1 Tax=Marivita sp. S0852 TaxID=3373893 RepID=UPI003981D703
MRSLIVVCLLLPHLAMAQTLSLDSVRDARNYVLDTATCTDIGALFTVPAEDAADMSDEFSVGLLFAATYIQGLAKGGPDNYSALLIRLSEFCSENPDAHWLGFR